MKTIKVINLLKLNGFEKQAEILTKDIENKKNNVINGDYDYRTAVSIFINDEHLQITTNSVECEVNQESKVSNYWLHFKTLKSLKNYIELKKEEKTEEYIEDYNNGLIIEENHEDIVEEIIDNNEEPAELEEIVEEEEIVENTVDIVEEKQTINKKQYMDLIISGFNSNDIDSIYKRGF